MHCKAILCTNRISNKPSFCSAALQEIIYNDNGLHWTGGENVALWVIISSRLDS